MHSNTLHLKNWSPDKRNGAAFSDFIPRETKEKLQLRVPSKPEQLFDLSPDEKNIMACLRYARRELDVNAIRMGVWVRTNITLDDSRIGGALASLEIRGMILKPMEGLARAIGDQYQNKSRHGG